MSRICDLFIDRLDLSHKILYNFNTFYEGLIGFFFLRISIPLHLRSCSLRASCKAAAQ